MRVLRLLAGLMVAVGVFAVTGEILARMLHIVDRLNGYSRRLYVATGEPDRPYALAPHVDLPVNGVRVVTNALGLRGPEVTATPAPGVHRVLVVGDSVAFGHRLPVEDAFPALLEQALNARGIGRYEVLNAGVPGYNSVAELTYLREQGLALSPEWVVVGFNLNDYDETPTMGALGVLTRDMTSRIPSGSLASRSELYLVIRWLMFSSGIVLQGPEPGERFGRLDRYVSALRKAYWRNPTDGRFADMVRALGAMQALARRANVRLVVAIVPDGDQIGVESPDLVPQEAMRRVCAEQQLECVDLLPAFAARAGEMLFLDIMHPNAVGQRLVAEMLARRMLNQ